MLYAAALGFLWLTLLLAKFTLLFAVIGWINKMVNHGWPENRTIVGRLYWWFSRGAVVSLVVTIVLFTLAFTTEPQHGYDF